MCWGDVGLLLSMPRQGLGNAAIGSVATDEQLERFSGMWAAMAITEPAFGSDSAAVSTTARLDGDHYVLNGEKIFVTSGERADAVVVWATLDKSKGRAAIKSFVVEKGTPGFEVVRVEHKLGIRASDTAVLRFENCRVPKENLLGHAGNRHSQGLRGRHADVRQHPPAGGGDGDRRRTGGAGGDARRSSLTRVSRSTTTARRTRSTRRRLSSFAWRRTTSRRTC